MPRGASAVLLALLAVAAGCRPSPAPDAAQAPPAAAHDAMAAASGVTRADGGKRPDEARTIPLKPMAGDV